MRTRAGLAVVLAGGALALVVSCNPKVQVGNGSECGSSARNSTFCDIEVAAPPPPSECWGSCEGEGTLPGPLEPPACKTDGFRESLVAPVCVDHRLDPWRGGEKCTDFRDCESVCCVREAGRWVAFTSGAADADASADADADAEAPTSILFQRAWQCSCGRCPSAAEVCSALDTPGGLGGP